MDNVARNFIKAFVLSSILLSIFVFQTSCQKDIQSSDLTDEQVELLLTNCFIRNYHSYDMFELIKYGNQPDLHDAILEKANNGSPNDQALANFILFKLRDDPERRLRFLINRIETLTGTAQTRVKFLMYKLYPEYDLDYLPILLEAADSDHLVTRQTALDTIRRFWRDPRALEILLESLTDEDPQIRNAGFGSLYHDTSAAAEMSQNPDVINRVTSLLDHEDQSIRNSAFYAYSALGDPDEVIPFLLDYLDNENLRNTALIKLCKIAPPELIKPIIFDALNDPDEVFVRNAIDTMRYLILEQEILDILVSFIEERESPSHVNAATRVLALFDPDGLIVAPLLINYFQDTNELSPLIALSRLGPDSEDAIALFGTILQRQLQPLPSTDASWQIQYSITGLGNIGKPASAYIDKILDYALLSDFNYQRVAIPALRGFGEEARWTGNTLESLIGRTDDPEWEKDIRVTLYKIDYEPEKQLEILLDMAENHFGEERFQGVIGLGEIGPDAEEALPLLYDHLQYAVGGFRDYIQDSIVSIENPD